MDDAFVGTRNDVPSENNGHATNGHAAKKSPPSVISNQLREELIRILKVGDAKHDGAFTVAVAAQIERFIGASREILMSEQLAQNDISSLMMMRKQHPWGSVVNLGGIGDSISGNYLSAPTITNNENFGVQAVRQLVDALRTASESPTKLVEALAAARANGLDDVAAALEKKLGVSKEDSTGQSPHARSVGPTDATDAEGRPLQ